ncbi:enoyl-CoA hydratase [Marmoricola endophyticus]|uniref:Enoyl-CoA hydratase n=1 Tax=Marmoricola endophyticus TaxID=2040280 RepID=A0A917F8C3_9ACTN|nr:crotonase/enoyl-CoA hydratase family protein [Marmoricola endophyticus]GGF52967.1 enoyl-CoA hydratase [Marmoricola endophyticus]
MTDEVRTEARDGVLLITLDRPEARNAVNAAVAHGVAEAVERLESEDDLRVGVLTGAGGTFCSGMDLKAFMTGESPFVEGRGFGGITRRPPAKPMIAAVEGYAVAGGFELVLACDLVVAGAGAKLGVPEVKRSLVAAAGAAILLPKRIPQAVAMELLLTGDPVGAERAAALGLVNRVVEDGAALDGALELAARIAANGPLAVAATKQIATATHDWSSEQAWTEQDRLTAAVFGSEDAMEGAAAFAEKRDPVWKGR